MTRDIKVTKEVVVQPLCFCCNMRVPVAAVLHTGNKDPHPAFERGINVCQGCLKVALNELYRALG